MSSIFISHSSRDNEIAKELALRLAEQQHHSVFLDLDPEKGIQAGQSWEQTLYRKLRAASAVICLCTDDYIKSHWCFAEVALARMEGKHLIALKVDPLSDDSKMPSILMERQFIDLRTNPEDGYRRLWNGLREKDILGKAGDWNPDQPPYLGLSAFHERDAPVFFGREDETRAGIEMLSRGAPGLIMVLGSSGSGKSSLVRAGMVPRLRRNKTQWLVLRPFNPGVDPFGELAAVLEMAFRRYAPNHAAKVGSGNRIKQQLEASQLNVEIKQVKKNSATDSTDATQEKLSRLMGQLQQMKTDLTETAGPRLQSFLDWSLEDLQRITGEPMASSKAKYQVVGQTVLTDFAFQLRRFSEEGQSAKILLIVDQFEELLGHEDESHPANSFLKLLCASTQLEHNPIMVLGTMRSDFLGAFQRNVMLRDIDFESLSIGPMKPEGMRKVIEEPAKLGAIELESGLADRLLQDTETPDALPLLSFTLWKLWHSYRNDGKLEINEYEHLGGLHGAIASEADMILVEARRKGQEKELRLAFLKMARLSEDGNYARKPVFWGSDEIQKVTAIMDKFIKSRLLFTRGEGENRTLEVAHEALFRSWKPLKNWLDDNRAELLLKQQLQRDTTAWIDSGNHKDLLWYGGRLYQGRELLKQNALSDVERQFIKAGIGRQTRQRLIGAILSGIAVLAIIIFALNARQSAKAAGVAKTETMGTVLKYALQTFQTKLDVFDDSEYGGEREVECAITKNIADFKAPAKSIYGLLCHVQNIVSLADLQRISGLKIFDSGPHLIDQGEYPLESYAKNDFGHYNPKFVRWAVDNLIPSENMIADLGPVQQVYDEAIKEQARIWHQVYKDLHSDPENLMTLKRQYDQEISNYVDNGEEYDLESPGDLMQERFTMYASSLLQSDIDSGILSNKDDYWREFYRYRLAAGFWIRRELDGTAQIFAKGLEKTLGNFDSNFLDRATDYSSPLNRIRDHLVGSWYNEKGSITFDKDGSYTLISDSGHTIGKWEVRNLNEIVLEGESQKLDIGQPLELELDNNIYAKEKPYSP